MGSFQEQKENLLIEAAKLHARNEMAKGIGPSFFEPGMMEFPEQSDGFFEETTNKLVLRFESRGTRYDGRTEQIEKVKTGDFIRITRDSENVYNPNNFLLLTEKGKDVGNMPAELCNAVAPLYDEGFLEIESAKVSFVEPISVRNRHAKQAILFVEMHAKILSPVVEPVASLPEVYTGESHISELQVINLDNTDITTWNFPALKAELQAVLSDYDGLVYTDDTIKDAKKDRTTLNKAKRVVDDARKAYKARCLEPYEAIEPQVKELTSLIDERRQQIDETVREFETRQKEAKEKEVREYYDQVSGCLGADAKKAWQKIFNPKWTNATTSAAKYRQEIQIAVSSISRDMESLKALDSPFKDTLTKLYLETLSMDAVLQKNEELKDATVKAGLIRETTRDNDTVPELKSKEKPQANEDGTVFRIHASQARLNQICDFMKAIGVSYEIL